MHRLLSIFPLLLVALAPARAANTDELLEPDKAFRFSAQAIDAATVEVQYAIADGYYLYRERLKLLVTSQGCADLGVCYVPQVQSAELRLASLSGSGSSIFKENEPLTS